MIFDNLLGPNVTDPDRIRLCDIIFPPKEVTILEFFSTGAVVFGGSFCGGLGN